MSSGVRPSATNSVTGPSRAWTQMRNPQAEFGSEPPSYLQTLSFVTRWHLHRRYNPSQGSPWPSQPSSILICKISVPILPLLPDGAGVDPRREFSGSALYSTQHLTCMVKPWWASHTSFWRPPLSPPPHTCSHHHIALYRATQSFYFNKSEDQLFSFGILLLQLKFQGLQGESCWKHNRPWASLQSSFHHSSHAIFRTLVCSLPGTRFPWRFSSVISLFTELWPWTSCLYLICTCPHGP